MKLEVTSEIYQMGPIHKVPQPEMSDSSICSTINCRNSMGSQIGHNKSRECLLLLVIIILPLAEFAQQPRKVEDSKNQQEIRAIIESLPQFSSLRRDVERGRRGTGVAEPYMEAMKTAAVRRASFKVYSVWRHGRSEQCRVVRRLYYSEYDDANAQITDPKQLEKIQTSGLENMLDKLAL